MQISSQNPQINDVPAFLRAMAESLEKLHAENRAHGALGNEIKSTWLNDARDALDPQRFVAEAISISEEAQVDDVCRFTNYCINHICGKTTANEKPFSAAFYQGPLWPDEFLILLETQSAHGQESGVTMKSLYTSLQGPSVTLPPAPTPVALSTPPAPAPNNYSGPTPAISIALRNGTVGRKYLVEPGAIAQAIAKQRGDDAEVARISHLQLPANSGLNFDEATGAVFGVPAQSFEGELSLDYVSSPSVRSIPIKVSFLINPDPVTLWKEISPPADAPYQKPLLADSEEILGSFRIVAASRRGRSHANKGEFRDDDYAVGFAAETGWLVVVVADGAGSAKYSRRGSQIACAVAKDRLVATLNHPTHNEAETLFQLNGDWEHLEVKTALRKMLYMAALDAHHKLRAEVSQPSEPLSAPPTLRNYDTTLILLVMKNVENGCVLATFAIGDGGAGLMLRPDAGQPITSPESGEHAGQTTFLTITDTVRDDETSLAQRFQLVVSSNFIAALAMTDGITDPKFPSEAAFMDALAWAALWAELQPALTSSANLLEWMNFFSPGNHDDRTLIAILPLPIDAKAP